MDLAEFLLARIAEDEAIAKRAQVELIGGNVYQLWEAQDWLELDSDVREHIDRHSPWQVLAECAAKRAIVEEYRASAGPSYEDADVDYDAGRESGLEAAVRLLASPYAAHPDYRSEWAFTE